MIFREDLYSTDLVWLASNLGEFSIFKVELRPVFLADKVETLIAVRNADDLVINITHKTERDCSTTLFYVGRKGSLNRTKIQNTNLDIRSLSNLLGRKYIAPLVMIYYLGALFLFLQRLAFNSLF